MTSAQGVETAVNVISNSPSQDYTHPDYRTLLNYDMSPGFKPFTKREISLKKKSALECPLPSLCIVQMLKPVAAVLSVENVPFPCICLPHV